MTRILIAIVLTAACSKAEEPAPTQTQPIIPETEIKRGRDACAAYVATVCKCASTMPGLVEECRLARSLPEALEVDHSVGTAPGVEQKDAVSLAVAIRKTIKQCIERTAKLPTQGCR